MANIWTWPPSAATPPTVANVTNILYTQAPGLVPLSVPPALLGQTPGAIDTEFETDPGWLYYEITPTPTVRVPTGVPDWNARIAGVNPAISFTQRKSFVTLQPGDNSAGGTEVAYVYPTPITWLANTAKWYWCGGGIQYQYLENCRVSFALFSNSAGVPSRQDFSAVGYTDTGGGFQLVTYNYVGGVLTISNGTPAGAARTPAAHVQYFGFLMRAAATRPGVVIEAFAWNDFGQRIALGFMTLSSLTATYFVGFYLRNVNAAAASGNQVGIFQADFVRELTGTTPPWARG